MQYLTIFLLVGLGLASAYTSDFDGGLSIDRYENADEALQAGGWISEQMRQTFEKMVEGFEKAIEEGRTIGENAFEKAKEIYQKLQDWGIDVGEKIKEAFDRISKDFEKNRPDRAQQAGGWISEQMRQTFEKMVESFERAIEEGKTIGDKAFRKAEEMYHKLQDWGIDVGEKIKEAFERISREYEKNRPDRNQQALQRGPIIDRLRESFENIVNKIRERMEGGGSTGGLFKKAQDIFERLRGLGAGGSWFEKIKNVFEDLKSKMGRSDVQRGPMIDRLKESFENVVNKIKDAFENGKGVKGDLWKKAEDIFQKLKDLRVGGSWFDKIKNMFEELRSKMGRNSVQRGPMIDRLKEAFENVVNKIKEAFDNGQGVRGDLIKKAEDIYEKLKKLRVEVSDYIKNTFEDLRSKMGRNGPVSQDASISNIFELFKKLKDLIKEKLDPERLKEKVEQLFGKKSEIAEQIIEMLKTRGEKAKQKILDWIDRILPDKEERSISEVSVTQDASISNIFELFKKLKDLIKEKLDPERLKEKVEQLFGKKNEIAEQIIEMLKTRGEKAKQKILDWIDRILGDKEERSISDVYDKLREFFKDLQLDLKERFTKFGEWVKEKYEKGLEKGKTRAENIRKIAKEFIEDTRVIGKDMAEEALGFFREYKQDLGKLFDNVVDKIGKIVKS